MGTQMTFAGESASHAFTAEGSAWCGQTWVSLRSPAEDLTALLEEALSQLTGAADQKVLTTFDFPRSSADGPGFTARLWIPKSLAPARTFVHSSPPPSLRASQLQPSNDALVQGITDLAPLFADGTVEKVVLAQCMEAELSADTLPIGPQSGGAGWIVDLAEPERRFHARSPELLLGWDAAGLRSMALAGTRSRGDSHEEDQGLGEALLSSDKDQREHRAVVDHIHELLAQHCLTAPPPSPARLLKLERLQHLQTAIEAQQPKEHPLLLAARLHPTPALCGQPRAQALDCLEGIEGFCRGLYGGVLGWFDRKQGELVVGLRAFEIRGHRLRLVAGAGCVQGSRPEAELQEIHLKREAVLRQLGLAAHV